MVATTYKPLPFDARKTVAVVIGGGSNVFTDYVQTKALLGNMPRAYYAINDQMGDCEQATIGITLHPEKLDGWLAEREKKEFPELERIYSYRERRSKRVTHLVGDWLGSSGLFAVKVALLEVKHPAVILCGVPMDPTNHYKRNLPWNDCRVFRRAWERHLGQIAAGARSWGGWTAQLLGEPTPEWLSARMHPPVHVIENFPGLGSGE